MDPGSLGSAYEALDRIKRDRARSPYSIYTGDMERSLIEGSSAFRRLEEEQLGWYPFRRLYSGVHVEMELLGRMASALRLRMVEYNRLVVTGLDYFHWRLDKSIRRAEDLLASLSKSSQPL